MPDDESPDLQPATRPVDTSSADLGSLVDMGLVDEPPAPGERPVDPPAEQPAAPPTDQPA